QASNGELPDCLLLSEVKMKFRSLVTTVLMFVLLGGLSMLAVAQNGNRTQTELSAAQRMDVLSSKLESMRRSLTSAISAMPAANTDKEQKAEPDDPRERLRGLEKEVGSLTSELNDIRTKQDRAEKYDPTSLDRLETSVADLDTRVQAGLQATASARTATGGS